MSLSFTLSDDRFTNLYYRFCEDIIESSRQIKKEKALKYIYDRWQHWRYMFKQCGSDVLSEQQVQGLLGELVFLKSYMIPVYGADDAIKAWRGPEGGTKDFEIIDRWYEIKSTNTATNSIKVSSLEQLDDDKDGRLVIIRMDRTSENRESSITLNKCIEQMYEEIQDIGLAELFHAKLEMIGYAPLDEYETYSYMVKRMDAYLVNDEFPRILRSEVDSSIIKVQYEIDIQCLEKNRDEELFNGITRV